MSVTSVSGSTPHTGATSWRDQTAATSSASSASIWKTLSSGPFLRLDCVADRAALRSFYERFGFALNSVVQKGATAFARYELSVSALADSGSPAEAAATASLGAPG